MTDYASVLLRNESDMLARAPDPSVFYREQLMPLKFELCVRYLREVGPLTDIRVIFATLWGVFLSGGNNPFLDRTLSTRLSTLLSGGNNNVA